MLPSVWKCSQATPCGSVIQCFSLAGVAAGRLALVQQRHVGRLGAGFQRHQFGGIVGLDAEVVDAGLRAARGDREVERGSSSIHLA